MAAIDRLAELEERGVVELHQLRRLIVRKRSLAKCSPARFCRAIDKAGLGQEIRDLELILAVCEGRR